MIKQLEKNWNEVALYLKIKEIISFLNDHFPDEAKLEPLQKCPNPSCTGDGDCSIHCKCGCHDVPEPEFDYDYFEEQKKDERIKKCMERY